MWVYRGQESGPKGTKIFHTLSPTTRNILRLKYQQFSVVSLKLGRMVYPIGGQTGLGHAHGQPRQQTELAQKMMKNVECDDAHARERDESL